MANSQAFQQVLSLIQKGLFREAAPQLAALVKQSPNQAVYWHLYSVVAVQLRQAQKGVEFSRKAIGLEANNPDFHTQLAVALQHSLQIAEALEEAKKIEEGLASSPQVNPSIWDSLGTVYTGCGDLNNAQRLYEKAVALVPDSLHFQFNLATAYRGNGLLAEAEAIYDKVIANNPQDYEAYANRTQLRKQTDESNHIDEMDALLKAGIKNWRDEGQICFSLAKECEDTARYDLSFGYLKRGADLRRKHMNYQVEGDLEAIDNIIANFSKEVVAKAAAGCDSDEPIFILGLPRTGTTLVERIVDSHSAVTSAGELQNFASEMIKQVVKSFPGEKLDKLAMIEKSTAIDFQALGQAYIDSTRPATGQTPHFIDKLPLNYLYIGLIKMALPNAKIIHLTRHPMDACYAIYKTLFKEAYPFSYDLDDMGRYYLAYHRLMDHWRELFPGQILDLNYETLVQNQEGESRRLIEFCGLDWEEGCLQFHKNPQASMTASAAQVRQPIYSGSVQKWRHYEQQLQPLAELLTQSGVAL